jgi:DNA-binding protein HU-beta
VRVAGFGTFKVTRSKARIGVNPRTGDRMTIEEKTVPKFLPAKDLKDIVNEG